MDILKEAQHSLVGSMVDRTRYVNTGPLNEFKKVPEPTKKSKKYFPQDRLTGIFTIANYPDDQSQ